MIPGSFDPYAHMAPGAGLERQCPHCHAVSQVLENDDLVRVCGICGGPRISFADGITASQETNDALKRAQRARKSRSTSRALGYVGAMSVALAAIVFAFTALVGGIGWAVVMGGVTGLLSVGMLLRAAVKSRAENAELQKHLDEAWLWAAHDAAVAGRATSPRELAAALRIDLARAEELHAREAVEASIHGATAGGEARANVPRDPRFDALEHRVRVASSASAEEREAEAEADAAAQTAAPAVKRS